MTNLLFFEILTVRAEAINTLRFNPLTVRFITVREAALGNANVLNVLSGKISQPRPPFANARSQLYRLRQRVR
jgi:hypothetical protein